MIDVLIVGAGPAGLSLAAALRRLGVAPRIVDAQAEGANTSRAAVVHARTLEVLQELEVTPRLLEIGIKVPVFRVRDADRILLEIDFSTLPSAFPFALMIPQNRTEQVILQRLNALGGSIERPARLTGLRNRPDGCDAVLSSDGSNETVSARWVVGCDGAHSVVREQAGIGFSGAAYEETFVLADVAMQSSLARDEINLLLSPAGLVVVAPLPGERFRIVATVNEAPARVDAALIQALMNDRAPALSAAVGEVFWSSQFHIQHRVVRTPWKDRILLCGDAAHVHSPAGGQGMNTGIQDAVSLAEPLRVALQTGKVDAIANWAERRHAVAEDVVSLTDRMTRAATLKSYTARTVRNLLLAAIGVAPGAGERLARRLAELDYR